MLEVNFHKPLHQYELRSNFTAENEILGILGPSGCGKSMTLKCIAGLETPTSGTIHLNGRTLFDKEKKINLPPRLRKIGYVFQHYALFPHLTVEKNIAFGIQRSSNQRQQVNHMIERMGLIGLEKRYPNELSGGEQQRVAFARTLVTEPDLLLLDEPFSALDSHIKNELEQELMNLIQYHFRGTVLFVTHNLEEAYKLCNRLVIYKDGKVIQLGHKDDIIANPGSQTVAKIIGCKNFIPVQVEGNKNGFIQLKTDSIELEACDRNNTYKRKMIACIHSYHAKLQASAEGEQNNTYSCKVKAVYHRLHTVMLNVLCKDHLFEVEMSKEEWSYLNYADSSQLLLHLPIEYIFLIDQDVDELAD